MGKSKKKKKTKAEKLALTESKLDAAIALSKRFTGFSKPIVADDLAEAVKKRLEFLSDFHFN